MRIVTDNMDMLKTPKLGVADYSCLAGFVVVKRDTQDVDQMTEGGVFKPQTAQDKPQWCTVVGISETESELMINDRVYISKYPPGEIEPFPGEKLLVIHRTLVYLYPKRPRL